MVYNGNPAIKYIVLHHTAVSRSRQPLQTTPVNTYHKNKWGMRSSLGYYGGYNFITEPTGVRTQYRAIGEETVAQIGMNCDVPSRCQAISYCMAGDFRLEKPTQLQVNDFIEFIREVQTVYPDIMLKQHKDVAAGRTCAELTDAELQKWITSPSEPTKAELLAENQRLRTQNKQLVGMVHTLIKLLTK